MFSIYILTYNEALDIAACIESAMLSDDVIVVDSCSSDRTREIAAQYPVRVIEHAFESHGKQRTWMLETIPAQYDWAYILEADERMTPALFQECLQTIEDPQHIGYYVAERVMFMDRWIRHSTPAISCASSKWVRSGSPITAIPSGRSAPVPPAFSRKPTPTTPPARG